jgi:glycerophosphoryl diester phosphodiesterase
LNLLRAGGRPPLVIGHRGAAAVAPENTLASLAAGVDAGSDVIEFDVGEGLVLAHSRAETPREAITLDDALEFLRASEVAVQVDVKRVGIEPLVVAALERHGLTARALVSSAVPRILQRTAAAAPELPRALGYPRDRVGAAALPWPHPVSAAGARVMRAALPFYVPALLRRSRATALALHCAVVSRAVVAAAHARATPVIAWTANEPELVRRLAVDGVDGIVSDDPRMVVEALARL